MTGHTMVKSAKTFSHPCGKFVYTYTFGGGKCLKLSIMSQSLDIQLNPAQNET